MTSSQIGILLALGINGKTIMDYMDIEQVSDAGESEESKQ